MASRISLYKYYDHKANTPTVRAKEVTQALRRGRRAAILATRRRVFQGDESGEKSSSDVDVAVADLRKASTREEALISLVRLFESEDCVEKFLKIGGALHRLAGIFTGHTPQHQILAAKCITNIASTSYAEKLIKPLGSYLVAFLSSPYVVLKDYSAWAIGNMAGDSTKCREALLHLGAIPSLIQALTSNNMAVVYSNLFALRNLTYFQEEEIMKCVWSCDIADALKDLLPTLNRDVEVLCEGLWLIGYLIHNKESVQALQQRQILNQVIMLLHAKCKEEADCSTVEILTALCRILGNSIGYLPELVSMPTFTIEDCLHQLVQQVTVQHLNKEADWVLNNLQCAKEIFKTIKSDLET